ncbi:hypothetical protein ISR92_03195 [Patescibacteria group bacterium]|nr:hypothetical protein [Patescibacteria group bacterium]
MKLRIGLQHYILAGLILLALSIFINQLPILQFIIGIFLLDLLSTAYGQIFAKNAGYIYKWIIGFITVISLLIIGGSILIYFLSINSLSLSALWLLIYLIPVIIWRKQNIIMEIEFNKPQFNFKSTILPGVFILFAAILLYIFIQGINTEVIYSVWALLSFYWVYIYLLLAILLLLLIYKAREETWGIYTSIFIFLSISLGAILYKLGYGFDYHIHTATTKHIWEMGTISPKPLYYIGYYSLILNFKYLLSLPLSFLNQYLVPIILASTIPSTIYYGLYTSFDFKKVIFRYLPLTLLLIPYSLFTYSTPQSFANTLFIILIALSLPYLFKKEIQLKLLWLLAITIALIHPITGVPAILLILFISLRDWRRSSYIIGKQRQILFTLITIFGAFVLPILFFINSYLNGHTISWQLSHLGFSIPHFNSYISIFDYIYNFIWLMPLLVFILAISGLIYIYRMKRLNQFSEYAIILLILIINYIWLRLFINFNFLIDYERLNYANRLIDLIFICSLPFIFVAFGIFIEKVFDAKNIYKVFIIILIAIILISTFYLSYPTRDPYTYNKSLNTSINDYNIVKQIEEYNTDEYIVLANQAVSAAALSEYGFNKYYHENIYYYPIPTSGPLYQIYLDAVYQRKAIDQILASANSLTNINNIYIVINSYWTDSTNLINSYKKTATSWQQLNDDYIFYYNLAESVSQ